MKMIKVLFLTLFLPGLIHGEIVSTCQVFLGSYTQLKKPDVVISIPDGEMFPTYGLKTKEEIIKTFHLKSTVTVAEPKLYCEVGKSAAVSTTAEGTNWPFSTFNLKLQITSLTGNVLHLTLGYTLDAVEEKSAEFVTKLNTPITLSSRVDDHLLFILCTFDQREKEKVVRPVHIKIVPPKYPRALKKKGISGDVVLRVRVDEKGHPTEITVLKSTDPGFNDAAKAAIKRWRWKPGTINGKPAAMDFTVTVSFRIQ